MITSTIMNFGLSILQAVISLLPASQGFPPDVLSAMTTLGGYTGIFSPLISVATLGTCLALAFSVEIGIFGFKTMKWTLSHLPFIGGRG